MANRRLSYSEARRLARKLDQLSQDEREKAFHTRLPVAVAGNISGEFLAPGIRCGLAEAGIDAPVVSRPYDSWIPEALAGDLGAGAWVIWISAIGASRGQTVRASVDIDGIAAAVRVLLDRGHFVVVVLPEPLAVEEDPFSPFGTWRRALSKDLRAALPSQAIIFDPEVVMWRLGSEKWYAPRYWTVGKSPCHPDAAVAVGMVVAQILGRAARQDVRAVVCDLDDTLWGGVIGEVGPEGLRLDAEGEGAPFLALQRYLKDLSDSGIPVCIVSKNDPDQARRPFSEREEMILSLDDVVFFEASWEPKYQAISRIAAELNLGLDQICFLDDSPFERDQAAAYLPGLVVPALDKDPEARLPQLVQSGMFMLPVVREDDRARVNMYKAERARQTVMTSAPSAGDYLLNLQMKLRVLPVGKDNLSRVASLVQKTNQFNLTNLRMAPTEILDFACQAGNYAYGFGISDRFGDSGLVSVVLGRAEDDQLEIVVWLMSCRVFNRTIEFAVYRHLTDWARSRNIKSIRCTFRPTAKNVVVSGLLPKLGFQGHEVPDGTEYQCAHFTVPEHFLENDCNRNDRCRQDAAA